MFTIENVVSTEELTKYEADLRHFLEIFFDTRKIDAATATVLLAIATGRMCYVNSTDEERDRNITNILAVVRQKAQGPIGKIEEGPAH